MSVKRTPPMRIAPLQRIVAEEITDPAEIAAIDKMRMRLRAKKKGRKAPANTKGAKEAKLLRD